MRVVCYGNRPQYYFYRRIVLQRIERDPVGEMVRVNPKFHFEHLHDDEVIHVHLLLKMGEPTVNGEQQPYSSKMEVRAHCCNLRMHAVKIPV